MTELILERLDKQDALLQKLFDAQLETHVLVKAHLAAEEVWQRNIESRIDHLDGWTAHSDVTRLQSLRARAERWPRLSRQIIVGVTVALLAGSSGYLARLLLSR